MGIPQTRFVKGEWNADCDECGFTYKASELRKRWDGAMVCKSDYETRHPQDLLRVKKGKGGVPWSRPPQYVFAEAGYYADGAWTADGTIDASGSGTDNPMGVAIYKVFGPVDPDGL